MADGGRIGTSEALKSGGGGAVSSPSLPRLEPGDDEVSRLRSELQRVEIKGRPFRDRLEGSPKDARAGDWRRRLAEIDGEGRKVRDRLAVLGVE